MEDFDSLRQYTKESCDSLEQEMAGLQLNPRQMEVLKSRLGAMKEQVLLAEVLARSDDKGSRKKDQEVEEEEDDDDDEEEDMGFRSNINNHSRFSLDEDFGNLSSIEIENERQKSFESTMNIVSSGKKQNRKGVMKQPVHRKTTNQLRGAKYWQRGENSILSSSSRSKRQYSDNQELDEDEDEDEDEVDILRNASFSDDDDDDSAPSDIWQIKDKGLRKVLQDLLEEIKWIDENAIKARIDSEKKLGKLVESVAKRVVALEMDHRELQRQVQEKQTQAQTLDPALEQRLSYLEGMANRLENQGSIVQKLADSVQKSVIEIGETMQNQAIGGIAQVEASSSSSLVANGGSKFQAVENVVIHATEKLEGELRESMKKSMHTLDVGQKIENKRVENQLLDINRRVDLLESRVTDDHEHSVQLLELLLKEQERAKSNQQQQQQQRQKVRSRR